MAGADKEKRINFKMVLAIAVVITAVTGLGGCKNAAPPKDPGTDDLVKEEKLMINQGILSDIGSTYHDIAGKYGDMLESDYIDGGLYFTFENSPAVYYFMDDEGNSSNPTPADDALCFCMDVAAGNLFDNFNASQETSDLEEALDVTMEISFSEMNETYMCSFEYNGCDILINMEESETTIDENSAVRVFDHELKQKL